MLGDLEAGLINAVICWHQDRLVRHPRELETFFETCDRAGVRNLGTVSGDVDLSTHDGQFHARILGAVARKESDDKSRRIRRKHEQLARAGQGRGGGTRPYGFNDDRLTIRESEAVHVREAAERVLSGESLRGIVADFQARGLRTVTGTRWTSTVLKGVLTAPRTAGLREHHGTVVARAEWPPILDEDTHRRLKLVLNDPTRRKGPGTARRYLLTGLVVCGLCEARLVARPRAGGDRCYVCASGPDFKGCGRIRQLAEPLEDLIAEAVFEALDTPGLERALAGAEDRDREQDLLTRLQADELTLEQLARDHYADKLITRAEFIAARGAVDSRIESTKGELARLQGNHALARVPRGAEALRKAWEERDLQWRRALVAAVIEKVILRPAVRGRNFFDPQRVEIVWRA